MVWYSHLSEFSTIYCDPHSQSFCTVNKAEIDVFLELSCFFDDPTEVGNLISGSSRVLTKCGPLEKGMGFEERVRFKY